MILSFFKFCELFEQSGSITLVYPIGFVEQLKNKNNIQFEFFVAFFARAVSHNSFCSLLIHIFGHFALFVVHFTQFHTFVSHMDFANYVFTVSYFADYHCPFALVTDLLRTCRLCCGLGYGEFANLLRTCYRETCVIWPLLCKNVLCADRAAVAVGRTAMSSAEMIAAGMRGKGVIVLHTYHDQLW